MSATKNYRSPDHGQGYAACEVAWCRWGGGAEPGKTHVFLAGLWPKPDWLYVGLQHVTDDFGDLVPVERRS